MQGARASRFNRQSDHSNLRNLYFFMTLNFTIFGTDSRGHNTGNNCECVNKATTHGHSPFVLERLVGMFPYPGLLTLGSPYSLRLPILTNSGCVQISSPITVADQWRTFTALPLSTWTINSLI